MINKVVLVGNVGKEPESRELENANAITKFTLATTEKVNKEERTEWHNVVCWGKLAEIVAQYVHKGQQLYVEGKIRYRTYQTKSGTQGNITEIVADTIKMLGGKPQKEREERGSQLNNFDFPE